MAEYSYQVIGSDSHNVWVEGGVTAADLKAEVPLAVRFEDASWWLSAVAKALESAGISEPLYVEELVTLSKGEV